MQSVSIRACRLAANAPKKLLLIENASHNNSMWVGDTQYEQAMRELFGTPQVASATPRT